MLVNKFINKNKKSIDTYSWYTFVNFNYLINIRPILTILIFFISFDDFFLASGSLLFNYNMKSETHEKWKPENWDADQERTD